MLFFVDGITAWSNVGTGLFICLIACILTPAENTHTKPVEQDPNTQGSNVHYFVNNHYVNVPHDQQYMGPSPMKHHPFSPETNLEEGVGHVNQKGHEALPAADYMGGHPSAGSHYTDVGSVMRKLNIF